MIFRCLGERCRRRVVRRGGKCGLCRQTRARLSASSADVTNPPPEQAEHSTTNPSDWIAAWSAASSGGRPAHTDDRWWEDAGLEDGPAKDKLRDFADTHPGWYMLPYSGYTTQDTRAEIVANIADTTATLAAYKMPIPRLNPFAALVRTDGADIVGVALFRDECCGYEIHGSDSELAAGGWLCPLCGNKRTPDFRFEFPAEKIVLCDNPHMSMIAAPGVDLLADLYKNKLDKVIEEMRIECGKKVVGHLTKLSAVKWNVLRHWDWCETRGAPTMEEICEAAEKVFRDIGLPPTGRFDYNGDDIHINTPTHDFIRSRSSEHEAVYDIGFVYPACDTSTEETWRWSCHVRFDRHGPRQEDIQAGIKDVLKKTAPQQKAGV